MLVSWEWICPSSTTLCHNSGMNMGKCLLIGLIHICNYWASAGSMIMVSHWWVIFEVWVMFWSYSGLHASYCLWTQEWGLVQNEEKVLLMANGVEQHKVSCFFFCLSYFLLPILNNSDLNVYLKDVHVHQWNVPYSVPFSFAYLKQHWFKCLSQRCPSTLMKCSLLLVFIVSTCQVYKQFSFLGLTQKSNLQQVTSFLISVHVTAV